MDPDNKIATAYNTNCSLVIDMFHKRKSAYNKCKNSMVTVAHIGVKSIEWKSHKCERIGHRPYNVSLISLFSPLQTSMRT